jgi:ABC-2 type transport system permease protein
MVLFAPLLTMRLLAEETREGTLELLLTAPVSDTSIVVGKFLSVWVYYTLLLLLTLLYQLAVVSFGSLDFAHVGAAYFGIWLYGGATLAVGMVFSAVTENQIIAAFLSAIALLILYFGASVGQIVASVELSYFIFQLTLRGHFAASFAVGVVRGEDVVYFIGMMTLMLYVTVRLVESKRWS